MSTIKRNYGIELLRIVAMYMIVVIHTLNQGGILGMTEAGSVKYIILWGMEILGSCAVNCYALISGYVGYSSKYKYSRLLMIWLQILFYTFIITMIFNFTFPEKITIQSWINAIFPVTSKQYWYLSSYVGMFFFIPFLKWIIEKIDLKQYKIFIITTILFFCVLPTIFQSDPYSMGSGYSMVWLMIMYLLGAGIRKFQLFKEYSNVKILMCYVINVLLTVVSKMIIGRVPELDATRYKYMLMWYVSPTMFIGSICLLIMFIRFKIDSTFIQKLISLFSSVTLGVYMIHTHPLIWTNCLGGISTDLYKLDTVIMLKKFIILTLIIYVGCSIIDFIRLQIFKIFRITQVCKKIDKKLNVW